MSSRWLPGADEFSPAKCAAAIRDGLRKNAEPSERDTITSLWQYHTEYLRVTAHGDGNRPSPMADGTVVYYSWQAATMAFYYSEVYGMALGLRDDDDYERKTALETWKSTDWDALWDHFAAEAKAYKPA